ncbi:DUF4158 domain-containing protein [Rhizobium sp. CCGE 510]|uniref:DUF4158 domain-containing protein n=1 Tax=Rhizobium sp. CCGE 510 TaxID=1132836 RepID=UPI0009DA2A81|nr:DUF4158 domain-containing protein [Rhizobium sp. CCGE 510]
MARRALLSEIWWLQATTILQDEREIAKHYTLDRPDLDLIMRQNKASNRLGLACVMALLRYPGRPLADGEVLPSGVLRFLARQIGVDHREIDRYFERPQTRREHLALLFDRMKMRPFAPADVKALTGWLTPAAQSLRQAMHWRIWWWRNCAAAAFSCLRAPPLKPSFIWQSGTGSASPTGRWRADCRRATSSTWTNFSTRVRGRASPSSLGRGHQHYRQPPPISTE